MEPVLPTAQSNATVMAFLPILLALIVLLVGYAVIYGNTIGRSSNESESGHDPSTEATDEELTAQREKILHMVEQKTITADEGVQLLNALPQPEQFLPIHNSGPMSRITPARKMVLAGFAIVCIGFMLPWLEIDMKKALAEIMPGFSRQNLPSILQSPNMRIKVNGQPVLPKMIIPISGGDSKTGWAILLGSAVAALLSIFYKQSARTTRNLEILAIGVAGLLALYVVFSAFTSVRYGLIIVLGGILIQLRGLREEWRES